MRSIRITTEGDETKKKSENSADRLLKKKGVGFKTDDDVSSQPSIGGEDHRHAQLQRSKTRALTLKSSINNLTESNQDRRKELMSTLNYSSRRSDDGSTNEEDFQTTPTKLIEYLYDEIKKKDNDLAVSAELGIQLSEEFSALQEEYESALNELEQLRGLNAILGGQVNDRGRMSILMVDQMEELDKEKESLMQEIEDMREQQVHQRQRVYDLERHLAQLQKENIQLQEALERKEEQIQELDSLISSAQNNEESEDFEQLKEELQSMTQSFNEVNQQLKNSKDRVQNLNNSKKKLEEDIEVLHDRCAQYESEIDELTNYITELTKETPQAQAQAPQVPQAPQISSHVVEHLEQQLKSLERKNEVLKAEEHVLLELLVLESSSSQNIDRESKKQKNQFLEKEKKYLSQIETLSNKEKEREKLQKQIELLNEKIVNYESESQSMNEKLKIFTEEVERIPELNDQIESLQSKLQTTEEQYESLNDNVAALVENKAKLSQELLESKRMYSALEQELQVTKLTKQALEKEVKNSQSDQHQRNQKLATEVAILESKLLTFKKENEELQYKLREATNKNQIADKVHIFVTIMSQLIVLSNTVSLSKKEVISPAIVTPTPTPTVVTPTPTPAPKPKPRARSRIAFQAAAVEDDDDEEEEEKKEKDIEIDSSVHIDPNEAKITEEFVNRMLYNASGLTGKIPTKVSDGSLYRICRDGVVLSKLILAVKEDAFDERVLNVTKNGGILATDKILENQNLCLNSCKAIGCHVSSLTLDDLLKGRPIAVHTIIWELILIKVLEPINARECPELYRILNRDETPDAFKSMAKSDILIRWINFHLKAADPNSPHLVNSLGSSMQNCEAYIRLLNQLFPSYFPLSILESKDNQKRAQTMLNIFTEKFPASMKLITVDAILSENYLPSLSFLAIIFSLKHGLKKLTTDENNQVQNIFQSFQGDPDARVYALWMNSIGVEPPVTNLTENLKDGLILLQLFDKVQPGIVDWTKVYTTPRPLPKIKCIHNANFAIELGRKLRFSLVGIDGSNIEQGNSTLTLSLVWQMMRHHIAKILSSLGKSVSDNDILDWANKTVAKGQKSKRKIASFGDQSIADSLYLFDLIDALKPGVVDQSNIKFSESDEDRLANAKYAISLARKIGATIFITPRDITNVRKKMVFTFVSALMATTISK